MQVLIVGSGRLATELLDTLRLEAPFVVCPWADRAAAGNRAILVHAGSGRELDEVIAFCRETGSVLIELSTGSRLENAAPDFPVLLCPNTNILMLKFMALLEQGGSMFRGYHIDLTESHQAAKRSVPGTAVAMAQSLGLSSADVVSVRDPAIQQAVLGIPAEHLDRHAVHVIHIEDAACRISIETRVCGDAPYAEGVARIVIAAAARPLDKRVYIISEFVKRGWL